MGSDFFKKWAAERLGVPPDEITIEMLQNRLTELRRARLAQLDEDERVEMTSEDEKRVDEFLAGLLEDKPI